EAGVLPPNDVSSAQAQRARQNVQLIQSRKDAPLAEANLGRLVGVEPGRAIALTTPVDRPMSRAVQFAAMPAATLVTRATGSRPERQSLTERESAMRAAGEAALSAARP